MRSGLVKQFIKGFDKIRECFKFICSVFIDLMIEKLKTGIFDGPQIHKHLKDIYFMETMSINEALLFIFLL